MTRKYYINISATVTALAMSMQASASFTSISHQDLSDCDTLGPLPNVMDELGTVVFPSDELIGAVAKVTSIDACPLNSSILIPNALLVITNLTNLSFTDLHYVADPGTAFSNFDGIINGQTSVVIDNIGVNRPLVAELGGVLPLVFEPGETWEIVLDDWTNTSGLDAAQLSSIGVPSIIVPDPSSGSIVANLVPEPASASLLAMLGMGSLINRSRKQS
jgi:hypothetical protein